MPIFQYHLLNAKTTLTSNFMCVGEGEIRDSLSQAGAFGSAGVHRKEMRSVDSEVEGDPGSSPSALLSPPEAVASLKLTVSPSDKRLALA